MAQTTIADDSWSDLLSESTCVSEPLDLEFCREVWEIFHCWKEQQADRFGAGSPAPSIPRSQRQYDGETLFDD